MPIRQFVAGQPFEPEVLHQMSAALERVLDVLGLADLDDPATRMVARKIIELAERGTHDANELYELTVVEFKPNGEPVN